MRETSESVSPTRALAAKVVHAAFKYLDDRGGSARRSEVLKHIAQSVEFDEWEAGRFEKSGAIRWQSKLGLYTVGAVKGGLLVRRSGTWYLTPEGREALNLKPLELVRAIEEAYAKWNKARNEQSEATGVPTVEEGDGDAVEPSETLDEIRDRAAQTLRERVAELSPYEFQDLVAALLRGMGYSTPVVAPPGRDSGLDIIAYRDPLGTVPPRIKVQVKHRQTPATVQEVRELMGLLQRDNDVGVFVSSGGFTPDAKATARSSSGHLELVDLDRFLDLWQQFYDRLPEGDKGLLPLIPVYFLDPT